MSLLLLATLLLSQALSPPAHTLPATQPAEFTVGTHGSTDFATLQQALDHAPAAGAIIRIQPGTYREKIQIRQAGILLVGLGASPQDTTLTWGDSAKNTGSTFKSGTLTVAADGFEAENLSIVNTWWQDHPAKEDASQAVALQLQGDRAVLDRVRLVSGQDTLFADSRACHGDLTQPCRADRQLFEDCFIEGNVDYIFGEAKAVFDHCELHSRPGHSVMITAQSRHSSLEDSGFFMLHCRITGPEEGNGIFFGRPWRDLATVTFYDTSIEQALNPAGWQEWGGRLHTATYREYDSHGPGVNGGHRSVDSPPLTPQQQQTLTPLALLAGEDHWTPLAEVDRLRRLVTTPRTH